MKYIPGIRLFSVSLAVPLLTIEDPALTPLLKNVTVPVGAVPTDVTVAVMTAALPYATDEADSVTTGVAIPLSRATVAVETLARCVASPG